MSQVLASPADSPNTLRISPVFEPEWLIEARLAYPNERPSFVVRRRYRSRNRPVILADESGNPPSLPVNAELIPHDWDNKLAFWTLRKGDETYIVKYFSGGRCYKVFLGEREKFADVAIAFPTWGYGTPSKQRKASTSVKAKSSAQHSFLRDVSSSDVDDDDNINDEIEGFEPAFEVQAPNRIYEARREKDSSNLLSSEPTRLVSPRGSDYMTSRDSYTALRQRKAPTSVKIKSSARAISLRDESSSDDDDDDDFEPEFEVQDSNRIHEARRGKDTSSLLPSEPMRVVSPRGSEDITSHGEYYNSIRQEEAPQDQCPSNERLKNSLRCQPRPNYNIMAAFNSDHNQTSHSELQNTSRTATVPKKRKIVSLETQDTENPPQTVQPKEAQKQIALIVDEYKQGHTTLRVTMPHAPFVPIKLRSCMTLQRLFDCVLETSGQTARGNAVSGLEVTFDWKQIEDPCRNMIVRRSGDAGKDSFEIFLETVLEAPCWVEAGGKCTVSVSPTLA